MPVTLATLIKAAPFREETRQKLLANLDKLTEEQKFQLSETCWTALAQLYFSQLRNRREKLLLEIQEGKKKFNKKDFEKMQQDLDKEFAQKLESAESEKSIEEIRKELQAYSQAAKAKMPPAQAPASSPTPPSSPEEPQKATAL